MYFPHTQNIHKLKYREALYRRKLEQSPEDFKACYRLALALHEQNKYEEALEYYLRAEELKPDNYKALTGIAGCLISLDKGPKTLLILERILQIKPDDKSAHFILGSIYAQLCNPEDRSPAMQAVAQAAKTHLEEALKLWGNEKADERLKDTALQYLSAVYKTLQNKAPDIQEPAPEA